MHTINKSNTSIKISIKENIEAVGCVLNLPPNSAFRITKLKMDTVAIEDFVLIDGKRPLIQHKTQFDKQDDMANNFKWLNSSDDGSLVLSNIQTNNQYNPTNDGKTLIISSSVGFSLELDYRQLQISNETGLSIKCLIDNNKKIN